ncbi:MAG: type VI secretion system baseplate subunit TssE [Planctomycetota bacterium]
MPDLTPLERLQPSLLDRLRDDEPDNRLEARDRRVLSLERLREGVLRDLEWLLNSTDLSAVFDLEQYPHIANSTLNFGLPALAGHTASGTDIPEVERLVREAILRFEPRILRNSLRVRAVVAEDQLNRNALSFEIVGDLWAQPMPLQLFLRTELDLESGAVWVSESAPGSSGRGKRG